MIACHRYKKKKSSYPHGILIVMMLISFGHQSKNNKTLAHWNISNQNFGYSICSNTLIHPVKLSVFHTNLYVEFPVCFRNYTKTQ